jgi:hypothetical protein
MTRQPFTDIEVAALRQLILWRNAPRDFPMQLGKVTESGGISAGSSGSVQPYGGDTKGEEEATGDEVQAYARFGDVDEDTWVLYARVGSGWEIVQAECAG